MNKPTVNNPGASSGALTHEQPERSELRGIRPGKPGLMKSPRLCLLECGQIYTNGAFVSPFKHVINGREEWLWKVDEFYDDSFQFGVECNPVERSNTISGLMSVSL
jgi:hypothetical protein